MELVFPTSSSPSEDPNGLWKLQCELLRLAEDTLGPRDKSKKIYQPVFADGGPFIRNTPKLDGGFAELSRNSEGYWPTAVYELAHETVHLLNPRPGVGNWLSEGIAVAFSVYAQLHFKLEPQCINLESYRKSLQLVSVLHADPLMAGRSIRATCGSLDGATPSILAEMFPSVESEVLVELCKTFVRE